MATRLHALGLGYEVWVDVVLQPTGTRECLRCPPHTVLLRLGLFFAFHQQGLCQANASVKVRQAVDGPTGRL